MTTKRFDIAHSDMLYERGREMKWSEAKKNPGSIYELPEKCINIKKK